MMVADELSQVGVIDSCALIGKCISKPKCSKKPKKWPATFLIREIQPTYLEDGSAIAIRQLLIMYLTLIAKIWQSPAQ